MASLSEWRETEGAKATASKLTQRRVSAAQDNSVSMLGLFSKLFGLS